MAPVPGRVNPHMNTLFIPKQHRFHPLLTAVAIVLMGAQAASSGPAPAGGRPAAQSAVEDAHRWTLASYTMDGIQAKPGERAPWIAFDGTRIHGYSGVNTYRGSGFADRDGSFAVGALLSTEMAGLPDRRKLEDSFLALLSRSTEWSVVAGVLVLSDGTEQNKITLVAAPADHD